MKIFKNKLNKKLISLIKKGFNSDLVKDKNEYEANYIIFKSKIVNLIKQGADVNFMNRKGETPLSLIVQSPYYEVTKEIINAGAYVHYKDEEKVSLLHIAVKSSQPEQVILLINKSVDMNAQDINGFTALMYISEDRSDYYQLKALQILLKRGANINIQNDWGETALHRAVFFNNYPVVKLFLENKADITLVDKSKHDVLYYAKDTDILNLLLNYKNKK